MKRKIKQNIIVTAVTIIIFILVLPGCEEPTPSEGKGNLQLTIVPVTDNDLSLIKNYEIKLTGPDNRLISRETEVNEETFTGLATGTWEIMVNVYGVNDSVFGEKSDHVDIKKDKTVVKTISVEVEDKTQQKPDSPVVNCPRITNDCTPTWTWNNVPDALLYRFGYNETDWEFTSNTEYTPASCLPDGTHILYVQSGESLSDWSDSGFCEITIDTIISIPSTPDLMADDDTGDSDADNITKNITGLTITGTAEVNTTILIHIDGVESGTALADSGGNWQADLPPLSHGVYSITVTSRDDAGNISASSSALELTVDTSCPAPSTPDLAASDDSGISNSDNITNQTANLTISGTGEAGSSVTLYNDNSPISDPVKAGTNGVWQFESNLGNRTYNITARAIDVAGNNCGSSNALTLIVDTQAPEAPDVRATTPTYDRKPIWSWNPLIGASVYRYRLDNGSWSTNTTNTIYQSSSDLSVGDHTLCVMAIDAAGNQSQVCIKTVTILQSTLTVCANDQGQVHTDGNSWTGGCVTINSFPGNSYSMYARANAGYVFDRWTATGGTVTDPSSSSTTVRCEASNVNVQANFRCPRLIYHYHPNDHNIVSSSTELCSGQYVTITTKKCYIPPYGSEVCFTGWSCESGNPSIIYISETDDDMTFRVTLNGQDAVIRTQSN